MYTDISVVRHGPVDLVTIERPAARNGLRQATYDDLNTAVIESTARAIVLTGRGSAFCSGDDQKWFSANRNHLRERMLEVGIWPLTRTLIESALPVIAAVNGPAVGWGMELSLFADFRFASAAARFGELFVLRNMCPDAGGLARLSQLVGLEKASELLMLGTVIDAEEALRIGLVSRVVEPDDLLDTALAFAEQFADRPPQSVAIIKQGLSLARTASLVELGSWSLARNAELMMTSDHAESVAAFLEKRSPSFQGR